MGADGRVRDWNPAAAQTFGYRWEQAIGGELAELIIPGPLRDAHRNGLRRLLETGESTILDRRLTLTALRDDGSEFPIELTITRVPEVEPPLFAGFVRELSDQDAVARENARLQQRLGFLAQVGLVLDRSLRFEQALRGLADVTVPELAQLTVIDTVDPDGSIRTAVAAAERPDQARAVEAMRAKHPLAPGSSHPVAQALRTRQPVLLRSMTPDYQREISQGGEHFELMRELGYHSAIVVPLIARRHVLGTLSLLRLRGAPSYDEDDLVLAEELARRAALALDNARLFESMRHLARTLQESLLPRELPTIPGARITGRYRAAAEGQEVGGDFYDAFEVAERCWGIVIGDVCGKGAEAAALTALARYTIRAHAQHGPAEVLTLLNEAVIKDRARLPERFLSALVATATARRDGLAVELASAGHPAPLVLRAGGAVEQLPTRGLLIGVSPDVHYSSHRLVLSPGDTIVLYTDGLTDARAPERILSESDLAALVARGHGMGAERLAAFLERSATAGENPRDDIALLVVELTRGSDASSTSILGDRAHQAV
ncbi:MAG: SpoIIE family protein phosphatase [Solirubrobacterales bacterium]|nr:SpoIIE family protein phosphatase [Solirubrobacterales bacterium]